MKREMRSVLMLAVLLLLIVACDKFAFANWGEVNPPPLPPPSHPPAASSMAFPDLTMQVGERLFVSGAERLFTDDRPLAELTITATSTDTTVVAASVEWRGNLLTIEGRAPGEATVAVTATEPPGVFGGGSATRTAKVTVVRRVPQFESTAQYT